MGWRGCARVIARSVSGSATATVSERGAAGAMRGLPVMTSGARRGLRTIGGGGGGARYADWTPPTPPPSTFANLSEEDKRVLIDMYREVQGQNDRRSPRAVADDDDNDDGFEDPISYGQPTVALEERAPSFIENALVDGEISVLNLDDFRGKYVILLFYPKDWTFVCPTELIAFSEAVERFKSLDVQLIGLSTDSAESHLAWTRASRAKGGLGRINFPLVADLTKSISVQYGVLKIEDGVAYRGMFILDRELTVKQITLNNLDVGRSVDEAERLVQALQHVEKHGVVCPAGWKPGERDMLGDPEGSIEYFESLYGGADTVSAENEIAPNLERLKSQEQIDAFLTQNPIAILDFYAPWCGKCRQLGPKIEKLAKDYPSVKVAKVDIDTPALKASLADSVTSLPTVRLFRNGELDTELIGYKPNALEALFKNGAGVA